MRKRHGKRQEEPRGASPRRGGAANNTCASALPANGGGGVEARRDGGREIALGLGSPAAERRSDEGTGVTDAAADGRSHFTVGEIAFARWLVCDVIRRLIDAAEHTEEPEKDAAA